LNVLPGACTNAFDDCERGTTTGAGLTLVLSNPSAAAVERTVVVGYDGGGFGPVDGTIAAFLE